MSARVCVVIVRVRACAYACVRLHEFAWPYQDTNYMVISIPFSQYSFSYKYKFGNIFVMNFDIIDLFFSSHNHDKFLPIGINNTSTAS